MAAFSFCHRVNRALHLDKVTSRPVPAELAGILIELRQRLLDKPGSQAMTAGVGSKSYVSAMSKTARFDVTEDTYACPCAALLYQPDVVIGIWVRTARSLCTSPDVRKVTPILREYFFEQVTCNFQQWRIASFDFAQGCPTRTNVFNRHGLTPQAAANLSSGQQRRRGPTRCAGEPAQGPARCV